MAGSGGSTGGDQARVQEQMAQDRARLAFLQSGALQDDAALNVQNISRVLQEYDRTSGQAMGMTALQLARSGNMSRTSRSLNLDRSMGINVDTPQEVLARRLAEETGALAELERQKAAHEAVISGTNLESMRTRLNELTSMTPTAPTAPTESDFRSTDREAYNADLEAWEACEAREEAARQEARRQQADSTLGQGDAAEATRTNYGDDDFSPIQPAPTPTFPEQEGTTPTVGPTIDNAQEQNRRNAGLVQ